MFGSLGAPELLIILAVVILIFGVGRISGLGKELGSSIKEFRRAVKSDDGDKEKEGQPQAQPQQQYAQTQQPQAPVAPQQQAAPPPPPAATAASGQQSDNKPPQVF
jgi:sec-independent protein translocase protein TatA